MTGTCVERRTLKRKSKDEFFVLAFLESSKLAIILDHTTVTTVVCRKHHTTVPERSVV